jgi:hypothetical protein
MPKLPPARHQVQGVITCSASQIEHPVAGLKSLSISATPARVVPGRGMFPTTTRRTVEQLMKGRVIPTSAAVARNPSALLRCARHQATDPSSGAEAHQRIEVATAVPPANLPIAIRGIGPFADAHQLVANGVNNQCL